MRTLAAVIAASLFTLAANAQTPPDLAAGFAAPPEIAKPQTWWHWMNGNVSAEGITADLEAMKHIGLGGAQIFNVSEGIPAGPAPFMSPQWREMVKHASAEAHRLGLMLSMHNCAGWSSSGGPWITPEHSMKMVVSSETHVAGPADFAAALPQPETKRGFYRDIAVLAFPTPVDDKARIHDIRPKAGYEPRYNQLPDLKVFPDAAIIHRDSIVDLSAKLSPDGKLTWSAPAGNWTVLRIGYTTTGETNHPSPPTGEGLECDKLDRNGLDAHWAAAIDPILADLGPAENRALVNLVIDSYEVGGQNWTESFAGEFQARRGYDLRLFLPVLTGRIVDSGEVSERFLWDFRRTIADLFADNYYGYFAKLCRDHGLLASIEPYDGPYDCMLSGRDADIPMGEFWVSSDAMQTCRLAASVGHTYGKPIIGSESFTADPSRGRWQNAPSSLKAIGDLIYTMGINRFIVHRFAHQPWLDVVPGMTMGQWGTHFDRTNTWWEQGAAWVHYLTRCQFMLQQGRFCADVCFFTGEGAPIDAPFRPEIKSAGYDYDAVNADLVLNRMTVENGKLTLPSGMQYRVMVLPDSRFMTPRMLTRLRQLAAAGATIIGPKPEHCPTLAGYPACDAEVSTLAGALWDDGGGRHAAITNRSAAEALAQQNVTPDCAFAATPAPHVAWIHRLVGDTDVYFLSNQQAFAADVDCSFRVTGRQPELWHADTGRTEPAVNWSASQGRTVVPVHFDPSGSVFVVFRAVPLPGDHLVRFVPAEAPAAAMPKIDIRSARYEAVDGAGGTDVTARVAALVAKGETSIPASNAAFGDPAFNHVKRLVISYTLAGKPMNANIDENASLELLDPSASFAAPGAVLARTPAGAAALEGYKNGVYEFTTARGQSGRLEVAGVPAPIPLTGPWSVSFQEHRGAPASVTLDHLIPLNESDDPGVKYFSGTATYEIHFDLPAEALAASGAADQHTPRPLRLELGAVYVIAQASLNGHDLGTLWKPPFAADIAPFAKPTGNVLTVRVADLWINRLIGDEQLPADVEWRGMPLARWPQWFLDHTPRPSAGRVTFTTWHHYTKNSRLVPSGLVGPVTIRPGVRVDVPLAP